MQVVMYLNSSVEEQSREHNNRLTRKDQLHSMTVSGKKSHIRNKPLSQSYSIQGGGYHSLPKKGDF